MAPNYSDPVLGINGGDPSFRSDDGSADQRVAAALAAFAAGEGSEFAAMTALASSRLLVPVVPVAGPEGQQGEARRGEKGSEMALPTLIGLDGRRAVPAFTCLESMRRWQPEARPVPVTARHVWQAAVEDSCAVVIDVAGPVPFAMEGARLAALARGEAAPQPHADPDVHEIVADVLAGQLDIASFELQPGDDGQDLVIALTLAPGRAGERMSEAAAEIGDAVMSRLGGRLRRGVVIVLGQSPRPGG